MSYFSADQQDYMAYLARTPAADKCWCGWYLRGECPNGCPPDRSAADKLAARCPHCQNDGGPEGRRIVHRKGCESSDAG